MLPNLTGSDPLSYIIIATVAIITGVIALLRTDRTMLRQDNQDLRDGRADDAQDMQKLRDQHFEDAGIIGTLTAENSKLRELNSARPDWSEVSSRVDHHNKLVEARWKVEDERADSLKLVLEAILDVMLERNAANPTRGNLDGKKHSD